MKRRVSIHPVAVALWVWLFIVMSPLVALSYLLAIIIHEFGHFFVARKLGCKMSKFSISPYGVALAMKDKTLQARDEIKIAAAGPAFNFLTAFFVMGFWWIVPASYHILHDFVFISLMLALTNLLPAHPLDGGRLFVASLNGILKPKMAKIVVVTFNFVLAIFFLILFLVMMFINFNPTLLLFSVFLFGGMLEMNCNSKYEKINIFLKPKKNFSKPQICCVYSNVTISQLLEKIQTSKTTIFCLVLKSGKIVNLSEDMVLKLSMNFALDEKLENVFKSYAT